MITLLSFVDGAIVFTVADVIAERKGRGAGKRYG
jgi:hypothetical protein